jgi:hypothetical protein
VYSIPFNRKKEKKKGPEKIRPFFRDTQRLLSKTVLFAGSFSFFVQLDIAEVESNVDGDFYEVQDVEEPAQVEQEGFRLTCSHSIEEKNEFTDNTENIANQQENLEEQALALSCTGNPGLTDRNRPGKTKAEYH